MVSTSTPPRPRLLSDYKHLATVCASFLVALFPSDSPYDSTHNRPCTVPSDLQFFIAFALYQPGLDTTLAFAALILLQRYKHRLHLQPCSLSLYPDLSYLFLAAYMISTKVSCDRIFPTRYWTAIARQTYTTRELFAAERRLCRVLDWNVCPDRQALENILTKYRFKIGLKENTTTPADSQCIKKHSSRSFRQRIVRLFPRTK